eukprot:7342307-Prymnesium_polylepis.1
MAPWCTERPCPGRPVGRAATPIVRPKTGCRNRAPLPCILQQTRREESVRLKPIRCDSNCAFCGVANKALGPGDRGGTTAGVG